MNIWKVMLEVLNVVFPTIVAVCKENIVRGDAR